MAIDTQQPNDPDYPPPQPPNTPIPPPPTTPPPAPANPWATAPTDGNWQHWWTTNVGTNAPSLAYLQGLDFGNSGVSLARNGAGAINGKVNFPGVGTVDVVRAFGTGDPNQMAWQWDTGGDAGAGAGPVPSYAPPTPAPYPGLPTFTPPTFKAPSIDEALNDPGYQFRVQQGREALQSWAAAKGTAYDSQTAKALEDYGQGAATQGYRDVWDRDYSAYGANYRAWADSVLNPGLLDYSTRFAATQHDNDNNYLNYWNKWKYGADTYKGA
jgi:hypothetical protein